MTADNLLSADVVLATGELVHASEREHPDLFWGLRGGGGNFGVVTSFEYRLHEVGPMIIGGLVIHPFAAAKDVLSFYAGFMQSAPDELVAAGVLLTMPDGNKGCGIALAYNGTLDEGQQAVAPLKAFGSPVIDAIAPMPYVAHQGLLEAAMPPNMLNYWKAEFVETLSPEVIAASVEAYADAVSPMTSILFFPIHGAASRVAPDATAYPHRTGYHLGIYALWSDPAQNDANIAWVRSTWSALQPFARGAVYVNELGEEDAGRVPEAYGMNYDRLRRIKARYDPDNVFCLNANIAPLVGV
jgi:FAD/FMN-containing dehydrogenase